VLGPSHDGVVPAPGRNARDSILDAHEETHAMRRSSVCTTAILAAGLGLLCAWAGAADLKVAVVDIDKVSGQYKELIDRQQELGAWVQERKTYLSSLQEFMFVSGDEFQEAARIYNVPKAQWSAEQKKREGELRKVSGDNEKKFLDLQAKPSRTPEEQNQYNTLRDTFQARDTDLKAISRTFDEQLKTKRDEVQSQLVGNVRTVIETIAKAKGYTLVVDKTVVYFVSAPIDDITEEVLKALNAAGAAGPGAAGGNTTPAPAQ
jgi:Skp family chaperone for outer membrane proteins